MNSVGSLFVLLVVCVGLVASQPFDFPPRLDQNFALGDENYLVQWGGASLQGARHDSAGPAATARKFALAATTFSDIVNAFVPNRTYRFFGPVNYRAPPNANVLAAIAGAGYELFNLIHAPQTLDWQVIYKTQIDLLRKGPFAPSPASVTAGFNFGRDVAVDRYNQFLNDGHNAVSPWTPTANPTNGQWRPTPPAFGLPIGAQFANATTWVMPNASFFRPEGPSWGSDSFVNNYREVMIKGSDYIGFLRNERSIIETFTASVFQVDSTGLTSSPGLFYDIAIEIARDNDLPLLETSRLLAYTALAMVDASYAATDAKYWFNDWRPVSGIRSITPMAATSLGVERNPAWNPLLLTGTSPDYVSMSATVGAAAGTVWRRFFGTDTYRFSFVSDALPGVRANYESFQQLIDDNGFSKVFGGTAWRKSCEDGITLGTTIGNYVYDRALSRL